MARRHTRRPWKEELKDLFSMNASERIGVTWLVVLCCCALGWVIHAQHFASHKVEDGARLMVEYAALKERADQHDGGSADQRSDHQRVDAEVQLFAFDPNQLPLDQWVALGLSERQAATIHKFEQKGGHFRTKRDLARMRVVDPDLFARWEPYIQLPDSLPKRTFGGAESGAAGQATTADDGGQPADAANDRAVHGRVEINTADTNRLVEVRGIGPAFARGIVKYRDRLGGFISLHQLSEVYILRDKPDAVAQLKTRLVVDTLMVRRFPINSFTAEELGPHPYAGWKVAKALVAFRQQHGPFKSVADIKGCMLVTDSVYRKLAPYLTVE